MSSNVLGNQPTEGREQLPFVINQIVYACYLVCLTVPKLLYYKELVNLLVIRCVSLLLPVTHLLKILLSYLLSIFAFISKP